VNAFIMTTSLAREAAELRLVALPGIPLVQEGDDIAGLVLAGLAAAGETLRDGDVLVIAQKIVSKAEGRARSLATVRPSSAAMKLASETGKDARLIELILGEATEVLRCARDLIIVEHRLGFVMANAGIDHSNVEQAASDDMVLLLPHDPDASCGALRASLREHTGANVGVIINDSHGRAWRNGTVGVAIGAAGLAAVLDLRGRGDLYDRKLRSTEIGLADELASAASLLMGQADEGRPVVLVRGVPYARREGSARELVRSRERDLFR
jgi:coenzyme F420-0:L-glutamate ligase/coenzyme F420-1:gamma-L-glutamate ligase